ncbi:MAG TPA: hypothetical protein VMV07_27770 [Streptosporangiaceae bacterium]|nr:hypothetical protein [Streptosporangiaceae bacterium]
MTSTRGVASGVFSVGLDEAFPVPSGAPRPLRGERATVLREQLAAPGRRSH